MSVRIDAPRLSLRELDPEMKLVRYLEWLQDPDVVRYLETRFTVHDEGSLRAYVTAMCDDPDSFLFGIVLGGDGQHIGNVKLGPIDRHHLVADIGIMIGERDAWGHGYATEAIAALADYAFGTLGLRKVTASAYSQNVGSIRAFERAGFRQEGVLRGRYLCDGEPTDAVLLGRLSSG